MLKFFEVTNFKGFAEKFSLDLSRIKNYEFNNDCVSNGIARFAQCYGPNASGKSNLGLAILDIACHLTDFKFQKSHYSNYLNASSSNLFSEFKYVFQFGSGIVEYEYSKRSQSAPVKEILKINNKLLVSLDRTKDIPPFVALAGAESLKLDDIKKNEISIVKFIAKNSILESGEESQAFNDFIDFVDHMLYFRSLDSNSFIGFKTEAESITDYIVRNNHIEEFQKFLSVVGINYNLTGIDVDNDEGGAKSIGVLFKQGEEIRTKRLFEIASTGTKSLTLFFYWYTKIRSQDRPSFIFIDEFDAFYHFKLSETVTEQLRGLLQHQIVLTTHNTGLLSNEIARPDCNFIFSKNEMKPLYLSIDKELRSAHNIEKIYRAGGFDE